MLCGAAGFLGSHLAAASSHPHFRFIEADVSLPWTWARDLEKPDLIAHFASPASPVDYGREPLATMAVNALGAIHGVELARATGAGLLFASTSEVYGDPLEHPQPETYWANVNPVGERACYDESKRIRDFGSSQARNRCCDRSNL